jgi:hypothetical protein
MKFTSILICVLLASLSCKPQKDNKLTTIQLIDTVANFGTITGADTLKYNFVICNTGTNNLILDTVTTSCGCISYIYSHNPIKSGNAGYIHVLFKPNPGESGKISKMIMVSTNTKKIYIPLTITYSVSSK